MKKVVIMSDNHCQYNHLQYVLKQHPDADYYIHCGDNEGYDDQLEDFIAVRGNNDWGSNLERVKFITIENHRIGICHGHQFGYFNKEENMLEFCKEHDLDILCSGHTHVSMNIEYEGVYLINPGSTALPRGGSKPSYAIMEIDGGNVRIEFLEMPE